VKISNPKGNAKSSRERENVTRKEFGNNVKTLVINAKKNLCKPVVRININ